MLWSSGLNWYLYCYQPFVFFGEQPIGNINEAFVNATRIYLFFSLQEIEPRQYIVLHQPMV